MSVVRGNYFDLHAYSMGINAAKVVWTLNDPATSNDGAKELLVSSARRVEIDVDMVTGTWSSPIVSTVSMEQDRYYTISAVALDAGSNMPIWDYFPWKIRVPEGVWDFNDLVRDWSSPLAVGISETLPPDRPQFLLNPVTGDLFRKKA